MNSCTKFQYNNFFTTSDFVRDDIAREIMRFRSKSLQIHCLLLNSKDNGSLHYITKWITFHELPKIPH